MIYAKTIVTGLNRFYRGHFPNAPNIKTFFGYALDRSFKKDDLSIVCGVWSTFIHMIREPFDKMDEFITKFEKKVADLIRCGIDLLCRLLMQQI